jgi:hypothetical protein
VALFQAQEVRSIMVEGQSQGDLQHSCMGMYELLEGKAVHGRGVWQLCGERNRFLYFSRNAFEGLWCISNMECMEAGKAAGWIIVKSSALTPDLVTEQWHVFDGSRFFGAPKLQVNMMSAEQQQIEVLWLMAKEHEHAVVQVQEARISIVEGQDEGAWQTSPYLPAGQQQIQHFGQQQQQWFPVSTANPGSNDVGDKGGDAAVAAETSAVKNLVSKANIPSGHDVSAAAETTYVQQGGEGGGKDKGEYGGGNERGGGCRHQDLRFAAFDIITCGSRQPRHRRGEFEHDGSVSGGGSHGGCGNICIQCIPQASAPDGKAAATSDAQAEAGVTSAICAEGEMDQLVEQHAEQEDGNGKNGQDELPDPPTPVPPAVSPGSASPIFAPPSRAIYRSTAPFLLLVEGQEPGDLQYCCMGMYELMEGKAVNGRGVWQHQGDSSVFLHHQHQDWYINSKERMEAGKAARWGRVTSSALTPDRATELWRVSDTGTQATGWNSGWHSAPKLRVRVVAVEHQRAELQRLAEEQDQFQDQAMAQAQEARSIMMECVDAQASLTYCCMGMYELVEGKVVNRRCVWQHQGPLDTGCSNKFLYFCGLKWTISDELSMEAGIDAGWIYVFSSALTPDQVRPRGGWQVCGYRTRLHAPKLRVYVMSVEQQQAELQRLAEEQTQAMPQAQEARFIMVEERHHGRARGGQFRHGCMGIYKLVEGKVVNGRGVWQLTEEGTDIFMYFNSVGAWFICDREDMEVGNNRAWFCNPSWALTPGTLSQGWKSVPAGKAKGICTEHALMVKTRIIAPAQIVHLYRGKWVESVESIE